MKKEVPPSLKLLDHAQELENSFKSMEGNSSQKKNVYQIHFCMCILLKASVSGEFDSREDSQPEKGDHTTSEKKIKYN